MFLMRAAFELLDTDKHGYDAELGHGATARRAEGELTLFQCNTCAGNQQHVHAL